MPPAFVLSQDQTLKTIVSKHSRVQTLFLSSLAQILILTLLRFVNFEKYFTSQSNYRFFVCLLRCLIFKVRVALSDRFRSTVATYLSYHTFKLLSRLFFDFSSRLRFALRCPPRPGSFAKRCPHASFKPFLFRSSVRQLCYNTTIPPLCQLLFSIFFHSLQIVYFIPFPSSFPHPRLRPIVRSVKFKAQTACRQILSP